MQHRIVTLTEFNAKCLAMLDDIGERGGTITITKRGRPIATVGPARRTKWKSPEGSWLGRFPIEVDPSEDTSDLWEVVNQRPGAPD